MLALDGSAVSTWPTALKMYLVFFPSVGYVRLTIPYVLHIATLYSLHVIYIILYKSTDLPKLLVTKSPNRLNYFFPVPRRKCETH
jgi:hypothetical protein